MRTSTPWAKLAGFAAAAGILAACSAGSQSGLNPSSGSTLPSNVRGAMLPKSGAVHDAPMHTAVGPAHSWMTPDHHKKHLLLYISDYNNNVLDVYKYPSYTLVGQVSGVTNPDGICNDTKGNIWVDDNTAGEMTEFAHGGTSPKATLNDPGYYPVGCSVDPTTGNLAVSNIFGTTGGQGSVAVYAGAKGTPTIYKDSGSGVYDVYFCGYDNAGNLFIDGFSSGGTFAFGELKKGASSITDIPLTGGTVTFPGNIRWDGTHVAVGDQEYQGQGASAIYQTTGAGGKIVGTTVESGAVDIVGFTIQKGTDIGPDAGTGEVEIYSYPAGGSPTKTLTGFSAPYGSAISK